MIRAGLPYALSFAVALGCGYETGTLAPIEPDFSELDALEICDGTRFGQLKFRDEVDDSCRAEVEGLRPDPVDTFRQRLILLGEEVGADGARSLYLLGSDDAGRALPVDAWASVSAEVTMPDGSVTSLSSERLDVTPLDGREEAVAVSWVIDYSASMREGDLDAVQVFAGTLLDALPLDHEAAVTVASTEPTAVQGLTTDRDLVDAALARRKGSREGAALRDAMGLAVSELASQSRPVRLLVLVQDGPDNASDEYSHRELLSLTTEHRISGLVLAALFADASEMRPLFGERGVSFQAPSIRDLGNQLGEYVAALDQAVILTIPPEYSGALRYRVNAGDAYVITRR